MPDKISLNTQRQRIHPLVLLIVFSTVLAAIGRIGGIEGFTLKGFCWVGVLMISIIYIVFVSRRKVVFPWAFWLPFFAYVIFRTDSFNLVSIQRILILITPIFAAAATSCLNRDCHLSFPKVYRILFVLSVALYLLAAASGRSFVNTPHWYVVAGTAMTFALLGAVACVDIGDKMLSGWRQFVICLAILIVSESRMPVLALPIVLVLGPSSLSVSRRVLIGLLIIAAGSVFFGTEAVQNNIFRSGHGTINEITKINLIKLKTGGRINAWGYYVEAIKDGNIWFGQGNVASVEFGQVNFGTGKWTHPHNEYIRLVFDYGIVGGGLYFLPIIYLLFMCYRKLQHHKTSTSWIWRVSAGGFLMMLLLSITGNALMYSVYFGNMLFATIGAAYASTVQSDACAVEKKV